MSNLFSRISAKLVTFSYLRTKFHHSYILALFTNFSVMAAMLLIMAKQSISLSSKCVNTQEFLQSLGKEFKGDNDSAIKEHFLFCNHTPDFEDCNHTPDFEDFSILATNNNDFKVTLMESLLINRDHPPLNKNKQSLPLELSDS